MTLQFCSLSSGSSGNCYLAGSDRTLVLVDAGISARQITERLKRLGNVIEIRDESRVRMDLKELYRRYRGTIIGDYIHSFGEEEDLSDTERKALFYGLGALFKTARFGEET